MLSFSVTEANTKPGHLTRTQSRIGHVFQEIIPTHVEIIDRNRHDSLQIDNNANHLKETTSLVEALKIKSADKNRRYT